MKRDDQQSQQIAKRFAALAPEARRAFLARLAEMGLNFAELPIVAADPKVLPIGSRIRVHGAGQYDGEYTVTDAGREIKGSEIDIYIANEAEAKRFEAERERAVRIEARRRLAGKMSF